MLEDVGALNATLGVSATSGDTREYIRILVEDLNARGGLAGREVVAVTHTYDVNSGETEGQRDQAACSTWTEDNQVFAALIPAVRTETLLQCLTDTGTAIVATGPMTILDDNDFAAYPSMVSTTAPSLTEVARLMADGLVEAGYYEPEALTGETTVGLVHFDHPAHLRVKEEVLKPALARHGIEIAQEFEIPAPQSNAEGPVATAAAASPGAACPPSAICTVEPHATASDVSRASAKAPAGRCRPLTGVALLTGLRRLSTVELGQ